MLILMLILILILMLMLMLMLMLRREAAHVCLLLRRGSDACLRGALRGGFFPRRVGSGKQKSA
jgi:hypothetical protein